MGQNGSKKGDGRDSQRDYPGVASKTADGGSYGGGSYGGGGYGGGGGYSDDGGGYGGYGATEAPMPPMTESLPDGPYGGGGGGGSYGKKAMASPPPRKPLSKAAAPTAPVGATTKASTPPSNRRMKKGSKRSIPAPSAEPVFASKAIPAPSAEPVFASKAMKPMRKTKRGTASKAATFSAPRGDVSRVVPAGRNVRPVVEEEEGGGGGGKEALNDLLWAGEGEVSDDEDVTRTVSGVVSPRASKVASLGKMAVASEGTQGGGARGRGRRLVVTIKRSSGGGVGEDETLVANLDMERPPALDDLQRFMGQMPEIGYRGEPLSLFSESQGRYMPLTNIAKMAGLDFVTLRIEPAGGSGGGGGGGGGDGSGTDNTTVVPIDIDRTVIDTTSLVAQTRTKVVDIALGGGSENISFQIDTKLDVISHDDIVRGRKLGEGGFGAVYQAEVEFDDVAVKYFHNIETPAAVESFVEEAAVLGNLRNRHVVLFLGVCLDPGHFALVSEFMPGGDLHALLFKRGPLHSAMPDPISPPDQLKVLSQVTKGLAYLHYLDMAHRDLKPANVLLSRTLYPCKLTDFGLTGSADSKAAELGGAGTIRYAAPEVLSGATGDIASDIYSLAVVVIEVLSKKRPVDRRDNFMRMPGTLPEWTPEQLRTTVLAALDFDAAERPGVDAVFEALGKAQDEIKAGLAVDPAPTPIDGDGGASDGGAMAMMADEDGEDSTSDHGDEGTDEDYDGDEVVFELPTKTPVLSDVD